jgi:hypothetical protein
VQLLLLKEIPRDHVLLLIDCPHVISYDADVISQFQCTLAKKESAAAAAAVASSWREDYSGCAM